MKKTAHAWAPLLVLLAVMAGYVSRPAQAGPPPPPPAARVLSKSLLVNIPVSSNADILTSSLTGSLGETSVDGTTTGRSTNEKASKWRLTIALRGTGSVVNVEHTYNSQSFNYDLNSGTALTAGVLYAFEWSAHAAVAINLQCETSTTIGVLQLEEVLDD